MWTIYKHENSITHQVYIGITSQDQVEKRWGKHGRYYSSQRKFFDAILDYGWLNFSHEILYNNIESEYEAKLLETSLIQQYNSINNGYNSNYSIQQPCNNENAKNANKRKPKYIDIVTKKVYFSQQEIANELNIDISAVSRYFSRHGKTCQGHVFLPLKQYANLTQVDLDKLIPQNDIAYKVLCIETNELFNSYEEAGRKYSDKKGAKAYIMKACREGCAAYKYHWKLVI